MITLKIDSYILTTFPVNLDKGKASLLKKEMNLKVSHIILLLVPYFTGCSVFESVESKEYAMTWRVDRDQNNKGHNLVEFEFVDFPGHVIGHFSNDLIEYLEG